MWEDESVGRSKCGNKHNYVTMRLMDGDTASDGGVLEAEPHAVAAQIVVEGHLHQLNNILLRSPASMSPKSLSLTDS